MNTQTNSHGHDRDKRSWSVKLSIAASALLVVLWLVYLGYLLSTSVTKQSVYVGSITFWTGALFAACGVLAVVDVACLSLAWLKRAMGRQYAGFAFLSAATLIMLMFFASGKIVDARLVLLGDSKQLADVSPLTSDGDTQLPFEKNRRAN
jgi:hypothetical protein